MTFASLKPSRWILLLLLFLFGTTHCAGACTPQQFLAATERIFNATFNTGDIQLLRRNLLPPVVLDQYILGTSPHNGDLVKTTLWNPEGDSFMLQLWLDGQSVELLNCGQGRGPILQTTPPLSRTLAFFPSSCFGDTYFGYARVVITFQNISPRGDTYTIGIPAHAFRLSRNSPPVTVEVPAQELTLTFFVTEGSYDQDPPFMIPVNLWGVQGVGPNEPIQFLFSEPMGRVAMFMDDLNYSVRSPAPCPFTPGVTEGNDLSDKFEPQPWALANAVTVRNICPALDALMSIKVLSSDDPLFPYSWGRTVDRAGNPLGSLLVTILQESLNFLAKTICIILKVLTLGLLDFCKVIQESVFIPASREFTYRTSPFRLQPYTLPQSTDEKPATISTSYFLPPLQDESGGVPLLFPGTIEGKVYHPNGDLLLGGYACGDPKHPETASHCALTYRDMISNDGTYTYTLRYIDVQQYTGGSGINYQTVVQKGPLEDQKDLWLSPWAGFRQDTKSFPEKLYEQRDANNNPLFFFIPPLNAPLQNYYDTGNPYYPWWFEGIPILISIGLAHPAEQLYKLHLPFPGIWEVEFEYKPLSGSGFRDRIVLERKEAGSGEYSVGGFWPSLPLSLDGSPVGNPLLFACEGISSIRTLLGFPGKDPTQGPSCDLLWRNIKIGDKNYSNTLGAILTYLLNLILFTNEYSVMSENAFGISPTVSGVRTFFSMGNNETLREVLSRTSLNARLEKLRTLALSAASTANSTDDIKILTYIAQLSGDLKKQLEALNFRLLPDSLDTPWLKKDCNGNPTSTCSEAVVQGTSSFTVSLVKDCSQFFDWQTLTIDYAACATNFATNLSLFPTKYLEALAAPSLAAGARFPVMLDLSTDGTFRLYARVQIAFNNGTIRLPCSKVLGNCECTFSKSLADSFIEGTLGIEGQLREVSSSLLSHLLKTPGMTTLMPVVTKVTFTDVSTDLFSTPLDEAIASALVSLLVNIVTGISAFITFPVAMFLYQQVVEPFIANQIGSSIGTGDQICALNRLLGYYDNNPSPPQELIPTLELRKGASSALAMLLFFGDASYLQISGGGISGWPVAVQSYSSGSLQYLKGIYDAYRGPTVQDLGE